MRYLWMLVVLMLPIQPVWAHDGELDTCFGHVVESHVEYPTQPNGQPTIPSEHGEYHFHWTPAQIAQAQRSLRIYFVETRPIGDHGTLSVDGISYDVLEYTRQQEALLHCVGDDDVTHTGIVRVRLP